MVQFYWRITSFPELDHLTDEQRTALLKAANMRSVYIRTVLGSLFFASLFTFLVFEFIFKTLGNFYTDLICFLAMDLAVALLLFQYSLLRLRANIRYTIMQLSQGQKVPCCLSCGYDLRATENATSCPECGANIIVPKQH